MNVKMIAGIGWLIVASTALGFVMHSVALGVFLFAAVNVIGFMRGQ
jgi:hypothetical protein